jgi:hypothetical protein
MANGGCLMSEDANEDAMEQPRLDEAETSQAVATLSEIARQLRELADQACDLQGGLFSSRRFIESLTAAVAKIDPAREGLPPLSSIGLTLHRAEARLSPAADALASLVTADVLSAIKNKAGIAFHARHQGPS